MVVALLAPLLVGTPTVAAESFGDVGYEDASFSPAAGNITGEKPESKLWWNDGSWWASMIAPADEAHHIFRLDGSSQTWTDTGVQLDPRAGSRADVLWDAAAGKLYVAPHAFASPSGGSSAARLYRFSYSTLTSTYALDAGFPAGLEQHPGAFDVGLEGRDGRGVRIADDRLGGQVED